MTRVKVSVGFNLKRAGAEEDLHFCITENSGTSMRNSKIEESEQVLMDANIKKLEKIVTDEQNCSGLDEERSSWSDVRDETEFEDAGEWTKVRGKSPQLEWRHRRF